MAVAAEGIAYSAATVCSCATGRSTSALPNFAARSAAITAP